MIEPISIDFESLNFISLVPMLVCISGALLIICMDLINKNIKKGIYIILTILFLFIDFGFLVSYGSNSRGFFDLILMDGISLLVQMIIVISSILFISLSFVKNNYHQYKYPEYFALFLFMTAGFQFMVASDSLILIFVGLETASLALYVMIAMQNHNKSLEAAIKYFTLGALSAAFYAFGSMIFYALTNSVELGEISSVLVSSNLENYPIILVGIVFMLASLGFKLTLVPFQTWAPDVYDGSSAALAGYISIVPKIAVFVVALRFFEIFVSINLLWIDAILYTMVIVTITLANIMALVQKDVKRMLAYSSISHAGFVMATILIGTSQATQGLFLYWILFSFTNLGAFAMLWLNVQKDGLDSNYSFDNFSGMIKKSPFTAVTMALFMLANAGIPPFALFWGKMYILGAAINAGYIFLASIMALNSAIGVYYYLKLIVYMFLKEPLDEEQSYISSSSFALKLVITISALVSLFALMFMEPLIQVISYYVQISGY